MDPYLNDWLSLLVRWLHLAAGIAWIGASFYFIALDLALLPPARRADAEQGVGGESWEIHGGGFYHVQKYRVAPPSLPETLHWFKWEAYTTWLSGFALLVLLYFVNAETYLIDRAVADLSVPVAIGLALAVLGGGWLVYDGLCRLLERNDRLLAALLVLFIVATAFGLSRLFSGRAVYLLTGAMLGTMMAANVYFVIIPGQRELVAAKQAGREPDPLPGLRGKQRSVHNNYLTLPVLFAMLSNHVPITYSHPRGWLVLVALMAIGAWVQHFFNLRHRGRTVWSIPASAALAAAALALAIWPGWSRGATPAGEAPVAFASVQAIVDRRCVACHAAQPTYQGVAAAPKGVLLDTPQQIQAAAPRIEQQAVLSKAMPLGNVTGMTQQERDLLAAWIGQGARVE